MVRAIRERPELELVASAGDGREALDAIGAAQPDVAVVGGTLGGLSGEQVLNAVARDGLGTRVVMIAARPEPREVYTALAAAPPATSRGTPTRASCATRSPPWRAAATVLAPELQRCVADEIRLRTPQERPADDREGGPDAAADRRGAERAGHRRGRST